MLLTHNRYVTRTTVRSLPPNFPLYTKPPEGWLGPQGEIRGRGNDFTLSLKDEGLEDRPLGSAAPRGPYHCRYRARSRAVAENLAQSVQQLYGAVDSSREDGGQVGKLGTDAEARREELHSLKYGHDWLVEMSGDRKGG